MLNSTDPYEMAHEPSHMDVQCILSVIEKLLASKFRYFGKYIIRAIHVSGQQQTGLKR